MLKTQQRPHTKHGINWGKDSAATDRFGEASRMRLLVLQTVGTPQLDRPRRSHVGALVRERQGGDGASGGGEVDIHTHTHTRTRTRATAQTYDGRAGVGLYSEMRKKGLLQRCHAHKPILDSCACGGV